MTRRVEGRSKFRRATHLLTATGLAIATLALSATVAAASPRHGPWGNGGGGGPVVAGTVASMPVNGAFTITTHSGSTLTVDVGMNTTYIERGVSSPTLASVGVGDLVAVFGTTSGTTVSANEVSIWAPPVASSQRCAAGTVASAPVGNVFTITVRGGSTLTVDVSPTTTTYMERGVSGASLSNVTVGEQVAVFGTTSGSTVTATNVVIRAARHHGYVVAGTVETAPASNSFTVKTWNGTTVTVNVSPPTTTYMERGVSGASLSNVTVGEQVAVFGTTSGTMVTAAEVVIAAPRPTDDNFATAGTVESAPASNSFTVKTWNGTTVTVDVASPTTTYAEFGVTDPSLSNVTVGEFVGVFGTTVATTVTATEVFIAGHQGRGLFGFGRPVHFGHGRFGGWGQFGFGRGNH